MDAAETHLGSDPYEDMDAAETQSCSAPCEDTAAASESIAAPQLNTAAIPGEQPLYLQQTKGFPVQPAWH